ncbi:hypothetical protein [Streptomyces mirabilis]|uniref:hypothetical protein n=1 Tax=Streptomyces mirabilis TaxID=68239 RepID=UPI00369CAC6C
MDFTADLMWDGATRDHDAESLELARTAALLDADALVGPLVFQASDANDLGHRLALVEPHLQAIAEQRGYPADELTADLTRRWSLLASARATQAQQAAASRQVTAAQEAAMDQAVAGLAALAARENPLVPMSECLRLATEAVQKHADAFPLAYESWGGTGDGPFVDRAKHWKPPSMKGGGGSPAAVDPGANGGDSTFDEVNRRLDEAERRIGSPSGGAAPSGPSGPASPTASLDAMAAGFMDRVKNWWRGDNAQQHHAPAPSATPAVTHTPAASGDSGPAFLSGPGHFEHSYTDGLMDGFDHARGEMDKKWDANAAAPGASREYMDEHDPTHDPSNYTKGLMDVFDNPGSGHSHHPAPASVPGGFSHADTGGASSGQQHLPTDPAASFSHPSTPDIPRQRQDWAHGGHFQYGT